MIRFWDKEVVCESIENVISGVIQRGQLISFFLNGHRNEMICFYDEEEKYYGYLTYPLLLKGTGVLECICREYLILDENVWISGRRLFENKFTQWDKVELIPVLDVGGQLLSFAYEDADANTQVRMLREIEENERILQYEDIYPEYQCVTLHGFNELAYLTWQYLKKRGIPVKVQGEWWELYGITSDECQVLEYRNFNIYAEGTWQKKENIEEELFRSVSVEFEFIERIYKRNLKEGLIQETIGDAESFLKYIADKNVYILGTGMEQEDVAAYLTDRNIAVKGYIKDKMSEDRTGILNVPVYEGKKILSEEENIVIIDCINARNAIGTGMVNYFDYRGCCRNVGYFCFLDYFEKIPRTKLSHVVDHQVITLCGDVYLCNVVYQYMKASCNCTEIKYCDILKSGQNAEDLQFEQTQQLEGMVFCVYSWYKFFMANRYTESDSREEKYRKTLKELKVSNYSCYYTDYLYWYGELQENKVKYVHSELMPRAILLGMHEAYSGNIFFKGILDGHEDCMMKATYDSLNNQLFQYCAILSTYQADRILDVFWKLYRENEKEQEIFDKEKFDTKLKELLKLSESFTSQELFVMIHIALQNGYGHDVLDIREKYIYWEPHQISRGCTVNYIDWLKDKRVKACGVVLTRNKVAVGGSEIKAGLDQRREENYLLSSSYIDYQEQDSEIVSMKFEDLKLYPEETWKRVEEACGLAWKDSMYETTENGENLSYKGITGFDLRPVYRTHDEVLSESDRLLIKVIFAAREKCYGYSYVDPGEYSKKELQEMMVRPYKYEKDISFMDREDYIGYKRNQIRCLRNDLLYTETRLFYGEV